MPFRPALIVVDMQNDFCPPDGSLAVPKGRDIIPLINSLLSSSKFVVRVATQDYHPSNHISFASNHSPPNNKPFDGECTVKNTVGNKSEQDMKLRLWPAHCVQGTKGAEIVDELDINKIDMIVRKGMDPHVEMYSVFTDSFGNYTYGSGGVSHDLKAMLQEKGVTHVYNVGLAGNYCVKFTAMDAAKAGFVSYVIEEGTKCVGESAWEDASKDLREAGVIVVSEKGSEARKVLDP